MEGTLRFRSVRIAVCKRADVAAIEGVIAQVAANWSLTSLYVGAATIVGGQTHGLLVGAA